MGDWGGFLAAPIASNFFVTAKHVGGSVGDSISFLDGTIAAVPEPGSLSLLAAAAAWWPLRRFMLRSRGRGVGEVTSA